MITGKSLIEKIESYISGYMALPDKNMALPLALWVIATHCFESFDAFPYLTITAATKQSGKTRLAELLSNVCNNPLFTSGATAASIFHRLDISEEERGHGVTPPTVFFDEAEEFSHGNAGTMRSFLNSGYRKGQVIPRVGREFPSYCPKVFILIGDVYDTLRDRSIVFTLRRGEPARRYMFSVAKTEGEDIRDDIAYILDTEREDVISSYSQYDLQITSFLTDRDEEIWTPLFCVLLALDSERVVELQRIAADMAAEKTSVARTYVNLMREEDAAIEDTYARKLLADVCLILAELHAKNPKATAIFSADLVNALWALPTGPWRKFRGTGLTDKNLAAMLSRFGVNPRPIRIGGRKDGAVKRGYRLVDVRAALE